MTKATSTPTRVAHTRSGASKKTPIKSEKRTRTPKSSPCRENDDLDIVALTNSKLYSICMDGCDDVKANSDDFLGFLFHGATNNISTSTVGMYGEIKLSSLLTICNTMVEYGLDDKSVVLDLGSGRGVPNFVFSANAHPFSSIGIEKCPMAYLNSINNMCTVLNRDVVKSRDFGKNEIVKSEETDTFETVTPKRRIKTEEDYSVYTQLEDPYMECDTAAETPDLTYAPEVFTPMVDVTNVLDELKHQPTTHGLAFVNEDITAYDNFDGVTHFYSFDVAMEKPLINNMVYQFMNTKTAWLFASFVGDLITNFDLKDCFIAAKIFCKMYISGESRICFVYVKNNWREIKQNADYSILKKLYTTKKEKLTTDGYLHTGSININQWNEPQSAIDVIKLSKLSLYSQYLWYLKKMHKMTRPRITRSSSESYYGYSAKRRNDLCNERDALVEKIANTTDRNVLNRYRQELKSHISSHFKKVGTYPG
ncbi:conserved hypothetical protein [Theileria equi strain WA]|uniref:DOT1 domain-containing protein n=1 Tax=Theileria equi strain WA TaxID=1537102 RepID=L1LDD2_THEEQ|nr:conserved hypothetical protein [Theileria equi strain WA]EKX73264.1 conserved hypothetical protein [Theileria equi strain WA]|eukprot:XP_004832716.1 conserved hypothetical protein [Theileria equi strain WA]